MVHELILRPLRDALVASRVRGTLLALGLAALAGCYGDSSLPVVISPAASSIEITPTTPSVAKGTSSQITATAIYRDNSHADVTTDLTWTSSNPAVATISSSGLISTVGAGSATITATCKVASVCGSLSGTTSLTVTPATLVSIAITPPTPSIAAGTSESSTATGTFSDHTTQNLSADLTWTSSNPAVATVSSSGLISTVGIGSAMITATCKVTSVCGSLSGTTSLTVTAATLVSIAVTPSAPSIAAGTSESFTATGTYSDNSTQNLTGQVTWSSATPGVATISNAAGSAGVALAGATGTTQVTAALGGITSPAITLTVTAATLVSIAVTPSGPSISVDGTEQFIATGTYSDNSTQILTTSVTWASSTPSVAVVSNASGSQGLATGLFVGSSSISAAFGSVTSPTVTLSVTAHVASVLHSFAGGIDDGYQPEAGLIQGADGNFYGTTFGGGTNGGGVVFEVTPAGLVTVLWSFGGGSDGANPAAGLIQGSDGNFYGTTTQGGTNNGGVVFRVTPEGVESVVYSLGSGATDGRYSKAGLIQGTDGNFYGTTTYGGANDRGVVFKITSAGVETVLWSFGGGSDGANPAAGLIQGTDGNFYGTTTLGGANGGGVVFEVTPTGVESVVYSFGSGATDGSYPLTGLILGTDGNFYGTTYFGGASVGVVFKITSAGVETVLWSFGGGSDGANPAAGLIQGTDGNFYGTTFGGGTNGHGTVFKF